MAAQFKVSVDSEEWRKTMNEKQDSFGAAADKALEQMANDAVLAGRRDIASSGHFNAKWQRGLQLQMVRFAGKPSLKSEVLIFHTSGLAPLFESGRTITAKSGRLLWIPTQPHMPSAGVLVRRRGIKLTAATVRGTPMLFAAGDVARHRAPLYIGVPSVTIRKLWHITEIVKEKVAEFPAIFKRLFKG